MEYKFRVLRADEIDCRVAKCTAKGFQLLLYKDARCDMNILDETVGCFNWTRDHREIKGNMYCGVAIYCDERKEWVVKWDCGVESFSEKEKGESSDSFKRACFNWGIGRELYTAPFIWVSDTPRENNGKYYPTITDYRVAEIDYTDDRVINVLKIEGRVQGEWKVIYEMGKKVGGNAPAPKQGEQKPIAPAEMTLEQAEAFRTTNGTYYCDLSEDRLVYIIQKAKNPQSKQAAKIVRAHKFGRNETPIDEDMRPIDEDSLGDLPF